MKAHLGSKMKILALNGGKAAICEAPREYQWFDEELISKTNQLLRTQRISGFLGVAGDQFLGGDWVKKLEIDWSEVAGSEYGVSFNSWTSRLEAAFMALGLPLKTEIIVTPWTMSATIAAIVHAGLTPVFCDIDVNTFNIDFTKIPDLITNQTGAICAVDIFGRPCEIFEIKKIAERFGLLIVVDAAQCPTGRISGVSTSSIADIGGFSLNRHKHIQSGEGGLAVTNNKSFKNRMQAIRNHGEVASPFERINGNPIIGHNWRLGELEALIACHQLGNIKNHVEARRIAGVRLTNSLSRLSGLNIPFIPSNIEHDYYVLGMYLDKRLSGVNRKRLKSALVAEGLDILITEYSATQSLPAFREMRHGDLSVAKQLNDETFFGLYLCGYKFTDDYIDQIIEAFEKVWENMDEIIDA